MTFSPRAPPQSMSCSTSMESPSAMKKVELLKAVTTWNYEKRLSYAYIDQDGDLALQSDLFLTASTVANLHLIKGSTVV